MHALFYGSHRQGRVAGVFRRQRQRRTAQRKGYGGAQVLLVDKAVHQASHQRVARSGGVDDGGRQRGVPALACVARAPVNAALSQAQHYLFHAERMQALRGPFDISISLDRKLAQRLRFQPVDFKASSVKSVGELGLRKLAKYVIQGEFSDSEGAKPIGFSHGHFDFVV